MFSGCLTCTATCAGPSGSNTGTCSHIGWSGPATVSCRVSVTLGTMCLSSYLLVNLLKMESEKAKNPVEQRGAGCRGLLDPHNAPSCLLPGRWSRGTRFPCFQRFWGDAPPCLSIRECTRQEQREDRWEQCLLRKQLCRTVVNITVLSRQRSEGMLGVQTASAWFALLPKAPTRPTSAPAKCRSPWEFACGVGSFSLCCSCRRGRFGFPQQGQISSSSTGSISKASSYSDASHSRGNVGVYLLMVNHKAKKIKKRKQTNKPTNP